MSKPLLKKLLVLMIISNIFISLFDAIFHLSFYGDGQQMFYGLLIQGTRFMLFYLCLLLVYSSAQDHSLIRLRCKSKHHYLMQVQLHQAYIFIIALFIVTCFNNVTYLLINRPEWRYIDVLSQVKEYLYFFISISAFSFMLQSLTNRLFLSYLILILFYSSGCYFIIFGVEIISISQLIGSAAANYENYASIFMILILSMVVLGSLFEKFKKQI